MTTRNPLDVDDETWRQLLRLAEAQHHGFIGETSIRRYHAARVAADAAGPPTCPTCSPATTVLPMAEQMWVTDIVHALDCTEHQPLDLDQLADALGKAEPTDHPHIR